MTRVRITEEPADGGGLSKRKEGDMGKTNGPHLRIVASCFNCQHEQTERYAVQGDSGTLVYCAEPSITKRQIGDTTWDTPSWCPLLNRARSALIEDLRDTAGLGHK